MIKELLSPNIFAAQFLISDNEMLEMMNYGYDVNQIASHLNTDENLVAVKTDILLEKGHFVNKIEHRNDFLKNADASH